MRARKQLKHVIKKAPNYQMIGSYFMCLLKLQKVMSVKLAVAGGGTMCDGVGF